MASLFEYNEESGNLEYIPGEEEVLDESVDSASPSGNEGPILSSEEEIETVDPSVDNDSSAGGSDVVLLSEEVTESIRAISPAPGGLSSSTLDYFDRLVSGLPSNYGYVAFRNDSDDTYSGTLVYGKNFDYSDGVVLFGEGSVQIDVSRYSSAGYNNYIQYDTTAVSDVPVRLTSSGTVLYYTNATEGYPILGGLARPVGFSSLLVAGLLSAMAVAVLSKLLLRR